MEYATRMDRLTPAVRAFLAEPRFAVLATISPEGQPQQTVMWYELIDDYVLLNTARSRVKDRNLRRDPRLSLCVEDGYRFVTIEGRAEIVDDQEIAQADIARLAIRYYGAEKAARSITQFRSQQRVTLHVSIRSVMTRGFA